MSDGGAQTLLAQEEVKITLLSPRGCTTVWPRVEGYIKGALASTYITSVIPPTNVLADCLTEYRLDDRWLLTRREMWIAYQGEDILAVVVGHVNHITPQYRSYVIPFIGGKEMFLWVMPMLAKIEERAKSFGCIAIEGYNRIGWARVAGFERSGELLIRKLGDGL